jgi:hypothetical protein
MQGDDGETEHLAPAAAQTIYEAAGGMSFFEALVGRFYENVASSTRTSPPIRSSGRCTPRPSSVRPLAG